jgi:hypothetical protein
VSEPIDDQAFEEYLSRESQLSKRYRALATDEVPAQLEGAILAQAREAVAQKPASARRKPPWMRWTPPLALAASMVLVISIVIESGTRHEVTTRDMAAAMPPPAPRPAAATADDSLAKQESNVLSAAPRELSARELERSAAAPAPEASQMQAPKQADVARRRDAVVVELKESVISPKFTAEAPAPTSEARSAAIAPEMPPPAMKIEVPPPAPVSAVITAAHVGGADLRREETVATAENDAVSVDEIAVTSNRVQAVRGAGQGAGPRGTVTSPSAGNREASYEALLQQYRESDPQRWLEYIRELRRENKGPQADREWRNFLKAYPDYKVDEKDVARAPR